MFRNNSWQKQNGRQYTRLSFTLTVNMDNGLDVAISENLRQQWANSGIVVTIRKVSANNYSRNGYDAILVNMSTSFSPNLNTYIGQGNISNYNNDEVNQILSEVENINDNNLLKEKYKRIIEIYNDERPFLSIYNAK